MDLRKVLIASIVVLAILARLVPGPRTIDDSFITFRYARNILVGEGFVYNPDARVLGTTTPLYTGLIVGLALFSGGVDAPFAELAWLLNTVLDGLTCLLLIRLGGRTGFEIAGLAIASVWAVLPYSVTFAIGGLETSLIVLLLSGAAYAALTSRYVWAAALASGALLTRPDALLLIAPIAIQRLATASNLPFARQLTSKNENVSGPLTAIEVGAFVIPGTLWGGFAWLYFGSPIPHSITAKGRGLSAWRPGRLYSPAPALRDPFHRAADLWQPMDRHRPGPVPLFVPDRRPCAAA